jgi:hypothetical protein
VNISRAGALLLAPSTLEKYSNMTASIVVIVVCFLRLLASPCSGYGNLAIVLVLNILYAVLCNDLDEDTLEINGETTLELLCAHAHDLETLLVVDVGVVVLVQQ